LDESFHEVYPFIRLNGTIQSRTRIEDLEAKIQQLEIKLESMAIENQTLRRVIEYSIPKDKVQSAIEQLAKEYGVVVAKDTGAPINLNDLIAVLQKQAQQT
jgi:hypothetical protein